MTPNKNLSLLLLLTAFVFLANCTGNSDAKKSALPLSPQKITPLIIGDKIPEIAMKDINGIEYDLKKIISQKPTILIFYRGIWCMYCNQHISQIKEISGELYEMGYQIIAISADNISKNFEMTEKYELDFPLLSDSTMETAKLFGIAFNAEEVYKDMLLVLEENSGESHHILPVPSVFILNQEGIIVFEYINPDFKIRISPQLLLTAAKVALEE